MTNYAIMDETGQFPVVLGSASAIPAGAIAVPSVHDVSRLAEQMFVAGEWVDRPKIDAPTVTRNADGWLISYAAPDGSICDVVDRDLGWLDRVDAAGGVIQFVLADAGPYQLEVIAPRPWLGRIDNMVLV